MTCGHVLLPQVNGGLHTTSLDAVGADLIHRATDAALGAGAHGLHPRKALVAVLLQRLVNVTAAEGAGAFLSALTLGSQGGQRAKAAQHNHLVQHANVGEPAAQQFALGVRRASESLNMVGRLASGAKR